MRRYPRHGPGIDEVYDGELPCDLGMPSHHEPFHDHDRSNRPGYGHRALPAKTAAGLVE